MARKLTVRSLHCRAVLLKSVAAWAKLLVIVLLSVVVAVVPLVQSWKTLLVATYKAIALFAVLLTDINPAQLVPFPEGTGASK